MPEELRPFVCKKTCVLDTLIQNELKIDDNTTTGNCADLGSSESWRSVRPNSIQKYNFNPNGKFGRRRILTRK